jgi:hypothetical protein
MEPFGADTLYERELQIAANEMAFKPWYDPDNTSDNRLSRAMDLIREGRVAASADGAIVQVVGEKHTYSVSANKGCTCADATKRKSICYHMVTAKLYRNFAPRVTSLGYQLPLGTEPKTVDQRLAEGAPEEPNMPTTTTDFPEPAPVPPVIVPTVLTPAPAPALRSISDIIADLSKPLPDGAIASKTQGGAKIDYIHWHTAVRLLDAYAPGWYGQVVRLEHLAGKVVIVYRISIPCAEGSVFREATGCEEENLKGYGDVFSNAEAMALKRAAAKFGVALDLYEKDGTAQGLDEHLQGGREQKAALLTTLGTALDTAHIDKHKFITAIKAQTGCQRNADLPVPVLQAAVALVEVLATESRTAA